ncbi:MAG: ClbS/DfsB family four-helix bundle protein [Chloroflexia bacterium]|nr:ClbS/DfsB family four-helix bundle protein [Chloroflexia bacterium]
MAEARQEPHNQAQLLEAIAVSWNPCVTLIDALADDQWVGPTDGQGWTVKDHVAHVTAWENVVIEVFRNGSPPYATLRMPEADWRATGIEGADALIHAQKVGQSLRRVKVNRDVTHARVVTILSELPEDDLRRPFSEFGVVGADRTVLVEMMDYLVNRYDALCASIKALVRA